MADNVTANAGSGGAIFAAAQLSFSGDTAVVPLGSNGLLTGSEGAWTYTLLVGGAGAVTAGTQRVTLASDDPAVSQLSTLNGKVTACNTGAVVVSSSALPSGAATAAKQPALGTAGAASTDVLTVQGIAGATAVKVDGSATTQPVSGTVTANIGTVGSLALESGGNLATIATNTTGVNNTVGTAASAIPAKVLVVGGSDGTNARALKVNTSGQADIRPLTSSDVVSAAQSGTWTVGLSASQTLATVTTVSTVTAVTSVNQWAGTAIDVNSGNKSAGTLRVVLATDQPQLTNALKVDPSAVTSPVSLASVPTHGVNIAATASSSGASVYTVVSLASNNPASVKASAGQVLGLWAMNLNASPRYVKFFNKATSPTMGTDTAIAQVMIPGNTTGAGVVIQLPCPLPFSTGIAVGITGGIGLTDSTSISANEVTLNVMYV